MGLLPGGFCSALICFVFPLCKAQKDRFLLVGKTQQWGLQTKNRGFDARQVPWNFGRRPKFWNKGSPVWRQSCCSGFSGNGRTRRVLGLDFPDSTMCFVGLHHKHPSLFQGRFPKGGASAHALSMECSRQANTERYFSWRDRLRNGRQNSVNPRKHTQDAWKDCNWP